LARAVEGIAVEAWFDRLRVLADANPRALELLAEHWSKHEHGPTESFRRRAVLAGPDRPAAYLEFARDRVDVGQSEPGEGFARRSIVCAPDFRDSYHVLSRARLPGPEYREVLGFLDRVLEPRVYLEIGAKNAASLEVSNATVRRIGVDPVPIVDRDLGERTDVLAMTSDAFFAAEAAAMFEMYGKPDLVFIDGLHSFAQTLTDFMNAERFGHAQTVICLHDTLPLDEASSYPPEARRTRFWTGDSWRMVACLRVLRPDLKIANVRSGPSGLCVVSGIDPHSNLLSDNYHDALHRFRDLETPVLPRDQERVLGAMELDWEQLHRLVA
jgi:hypothetical protein